MHRRPSQHPVEPGPHFGELGREVDAGEQGGIDPSNQADVGNTVLAPAWADDVVAIGKSRVEDAVQSLCFADVALDTPSDLLRSRSEEVVCLALPYCFDLVSMNEEIRK